MNFSFFYLFFIFFQVKKLVHDGQEVVIVGGLHALHRHEKLAIALSKAMRGHSVQETKKDGRFHVHTKTYLDGAILKEVGFFSNFYRCLKRMILHVSMLVNQSLEIFIAGDGTVC